MQAAFRPPMPGTSRLLDGGSVRAVGVACPTRTTCKLGRMDDLESEGTRPREFWRTSRAECELKWFGQISAGYYVFFAGTPYGHFYGPPDGAAPVHYLQTCQDDILYANDPPAGSGQAP